MSAHPYTKILCLDKSLLSEQGDVSKRSFSLIDVCSRFSSFVNPVHVHSILASCTSGLSNVNTGKTSLVVETRESVNQSL